MINKKFVALGLLFCLIFPNSIVVLAQEYKYPDYAFEYLGEDRYENFNRKMFNFNLKLNKYAIRPIHILWSSIMPEYCMDRIQGMTNNIEYPIRLVSSLIQRDFTTSKNETIRFFTNTIIGLGGMYDPAKHLFNIEQSNENMEQALAGCKLKSGQYFVFPVLSFTCWCGLLGKILDAALNPGSYIATPVLAIVKAGLTINKTSYMQPLIKMVESTYADPYEIAKKAYGIERYIKCANLDRIDLFKNMPKFEDESPKLVEKPSQPAPVPAVKKDTKLVEIEVSSEIITPDIIKGGTFMDEFLTNPGTEFKLKSDIILPNYHPQSPVVDSMRTALFDLPGVDESVWNELSIWNRSFSKRIRTSSVPVTDGKDSYRFRYIMQKDKSSPMAFVYPSIGEGIMSSHSVLLAKILYDAGYSVVIQGSHFQWEFVKSMPDNYKPGLPAYDAELLKTVSSKIVDSLEAKYQCKVGDKLFIGTSFGALTTLFIAASESKHNTLGNAKFISICPPVELTYAMKQVDKNSEEWNKSSDDLKQRVALTAAKVLKLYETKDEKKKEITALPFTDEEGKLITGFIMHQKLSDLIFTIENGSKSNKSDIYHIINNMNYQDYAEKYLFSVADKSSDDFTYETSLHSISDYLANNDNYKIYHSINDYLTSTFQLKRLKEYTGPNTVLVDNGAHLGFLYRDEFIQHLKDSIALNK